MTIVMPKKAERKAAEQPAKKSLDEIKKERMAEAFMEQAPDGRIGASKRKSKDGVVKITLTLRDEDLTEFDILAEDLSYSRSGLIKELMKKAVREGGIY